MTLRATILGALLIACASPFLGPPPVSAQPTLGTRVIWSPAGPVNDGFGHSVALSWVAVIGAPADVGHGAAAGAAWVFGPSPPEQGPITGRRMDPNPARLSPEQVAAGDLFGWSVATGGDQLVVGAPGDSVGPGGNREPDRWRARGAAYVFFAGMRRPTFAYHWWLLARLQPPELQRDDGFGSRVAIGGDLVYVAAPDADVVAGDGRLVVDAGAVWVFSCWANGGLFPTYPVQPASCTQKARLTSPAGPLAGGRFGAALAASDVLLVGEPGARAVWSLEHRWGTEAPYPLSFLAARVPGGGADEGQSYGESLAAFNNRAFVGEPERRDAGASAAAATGVAWMFERVPGADSGTAGFWVARGRLTPLGPASAGYGMAVAAATGLGLTAADGVALGPANGCRIAPPYACNAPTPPNELPLPIRLFDGAGRGYQLALPLPQGLPATARYGSALAAQGTRLLVGASGPLSLTPSAVLLGENVTFGGPGRVYDYNNVDLATLDRDADTLPDAFEATFGLDLFSAAGRDGAAGDPDQDGLTNAEEYRQGSHPRGSLTRYFAEGAVNDGHSLLTQSVTRFFDTQFAVLNPGGSPASVLFRFMRTDGTLVPMILAVPAHSRKTLDARDVPGLMVRTTSVSHPPLESAEFSTVVESDVQVVVDRTMDWDDRRYGAHGETAVAAPALTWYLAEGATHGGFNLFYLLQNPNAAEAEVRVRYLRPSGAPLEKTYTLLSNSRTNIWVDYEEFPGLGLALASTDVSAVFEVLNGQPIIVERAMYADVPGQMFGAGHESAGVTAPALEWFLAEGATGSYFDLFVLIANPGTADAQVEATYLLPDGTTVVKPYTVTANSRFNIWVDYEDAKLADTAVSTTIRATNGVPVIVERAMWWPGPTPATWYEAHNSAGATATGTRWALAEGEVDTARNLETYILIAITSATAATVKVTLLFEDGTSAEQTYAGIPARSRFNVPVGAFFQQAAGKRFGAIVESLGADARADRRRAGDILGRGRAALGGGHQRACDQAAVACTAS